MLEANMWQAQPDPEAIYADKFSALTRGLKGLITDEANLLPSRDQSQIFVIGFCQGAIVAQQLMF